MEYLPSLIVWVVIIGAVVYNVFIKKSKNRAAARSGEDLERVRQAARQYLATADNPTIVYAHWEKQESYGRSVRTTYYRYAVAFQGQTMWVFPLHVDKKTHQVQAAEPMTLTAEKLGKVTVTTTEKDGAPSRLDVWLGDKQGHVIVQLYVDAEHLSKSRWYPLNILQTEECAAFGRFITPLAQRVAGENPDVDAKLAAEANASVGRLGMGVSIAGIVASFLFPFVGIPVCLLGLILSIVSKVKGAKKKYLLVSGACMVASLAYGAFFLKFIFV